MALPDHANGAVVQRHELKLELKMN
jgi:hypothetical protein